MSFSVSWPISSSNSASADTAFYHSFLLHNIELVRNNKHTYKIYKGDSLAHQAIHLLLKWLEAFHHLQPKKISDLQHAPWYSSDILDKLYSGYWRSTPYLVLSNQRSHLRSRWWKQDHPWDQATTSLQTILPSVALRCNQLLSSSAASWHLWILLLENLYSLGSLEACNTTLWES